MKKSQGNSRKKPERKRKPKTHASDYDGAWKGGLERHWEVCCGTFWPTMFAEIDWQRPVVWLNKEISQILATAGQRNRSVDLLVRVWLKSGQEQCLLIHVEVQTEPEDDFDFRLSRYNSGIEWTYGVPVATLVILADLRENWRPSSYRVKFGGFRKEMEFVTCKLIDRIDDEWADDHSLPVLLARAQIAALRTASDPEARYRAKWDLVRGLYTLGLSADEVREIFRLIDWMMHLTKDLERRFKVELSELEERLEMTYVTSVERLAKEEGREEGRKEAIIDMLLMMLRRNCGEFTGQDEERIGSLSLQQLKKLAEAGLGFTSTEDLNTWFNDNNVN